ncbi:hypothetical protein DFH29DRAFT_1024640 [Suillus ampliporus]|nr:hypothetical protein DFH29DRAFT_1024640 [Suillus ampliporus]
MTASSTATEPHWHPSRLLALLNRQGTVSLANHGVLGVTVIFKSGIMLQREIPALILNLIVTVCTECTGFVHGISLRSALASESRLRFNTNLRLLTAARGWSNPNGALLDDIMAVLLKVHWQLYDMKNLVLSIAGLPLLISGVALLLQVVIALSGLRAAKVLTWSSSPFDLTAALVHHMQLTPVPFRCMRGAFDLDMDGGPVKPSETQPSAWHAHPSIRKVVISLWGLVVACAGWATLDMCIWDKYNGTIFTSPALTTQTWPFFPGSQSNYIMYDFLSVGVQWWILAFVNLAVVQGPLTLGLHCAELIVNAIRDERQWRCATRRKGLSRTAGNPLKPVFTDLPCFVLFFAKPLLHWMFGLSCIGADFVVNGVIHSFMTSIFTAQIWNLCIALFVFACFFTVVALRRPCGPQPAAYGHLQTLANLMDESSPVMWWGHKEDGIPYCHAGTSDHPLPDVKMNCVYAGLSVMSHPYIS